MLLFLEGFMVLNFQRRDGIYFWKSRFAALWPCLELLGVPQACLQAAFVPDSQFVYYLVQPQTWHVLVWFSQHLCESSWDYHTFHIIDWLSCVAQGTLLSFLVVCPWGRSEACLQHIGSFQSSGPWASSQARTLSLETFLHLQMDSMIPGRVFCCSEH